MEMTSRRSLTIAMLVVGAAVAAWVAPLAAVRASAGARTTGDEPQYLMTALSLAEDHDLDLADERAHRAYVDFHAPVPLVQERVRDDGSMVSPHDPLLPAVLALPMALGGWVAAKLVLAAIAGALAAALVWVAVRRFAVPLTVAVLTVLAFALAAPLAVYGTQVYPELPAALALTIAVGALTGPLRRGGIVTVACTVIALPWLSVKYSPVAVALVAVALFRLWRRGDRRSALLLVSGMGLAAMVFLAAHQMLYEGWTVYASGDHFRAGEASVAGIDPDYLGRSHRLLGLLTDRGFGLAAWQPAFLLALPATVALVRARPPGWAALGIPLAAGWLNATFVALTMHGWWWPGRQVVVVLPCAVLAIAWWAGRYERVRPWLVAGAVLGAITVAWLTVEGLLGPRTLVVSFEQTTNPWYRLWRLVLPDGRGVPAGTDALRALWYGAAGLLALWGWRSLRPRATATGHDDSRPAHERGGNMRTRPILIALVTAAVALSAAACSDDDGSDVRSRGEGSGTGSGSGSGTGSGSGSGTGITGECVPVGNLATAATRVNVSLDEFAIDVETPSAPAGAVGFVAQNDGEEPHELVIVKGVAPDALPLDDDGALDEGGLPDGALIGEIEPFSGGTSCSGVFELTADDYTLVCNIVEEEEHEAHLEEGMLTTFTVT